MDSVLIELANDNDLVGASRRLDQVIFRHTRSSCNSNKALNNVWMFLHQAEIVPDSHECQTANVNLKNNKIIINRRFFLDYIKSFEDLAFIVLRERHHIALRYLHTVDISRILWNVDNIQIALQNFMEDAYINGIVRRFVDTDLPERFYGFREGNRPGMERWLMHPQCFDNYDSGYDFYAGLQEVKVYTMLCNIYKYQSNSIDLKEEDITFKHWVQMAYAYFLKYLNEDDTDRSSESGETDSGEEKNDDNIGGNKDQFQGEAKEVKQGESHEELESDNEEENNKQGSEELLYQPISDSSYQSPEESQQDEEQQLEEQARHYNKSGGGSYYVTTKTIVPKSMEWDACLISKTSNNDPMELNAQVMLDTNLIDGFHEAANGLVIKAQHTDKQMPFAYLPHRVSRRDAFSLGMGFQPILWQHYIENVAKKHYSIYFDVSDSMTDYIGYLPSFLKALRNVAYTVYNFSRCVVEMQNHLCSRYYLGSGGTSFKAVGEHMLDNRVTHAFVLTDGCGMVPKEMLSHLKQQLLDLILIKMGEAPEKSEWDILASQIVGEEGWERPGVWPGR